MSKKKKPVTRQTAPKNVKRFDPEKSRFVVPVSFGVFFLALVIVFSDFLFSNKMLYGSDMISAGIFMRSLYIDYLAEAGKMLQWDPYIFGGVPYVEAFHGDIFYPFSTLKFFGSIYRMLGYNFFFHIFLSSITMYLCARQFKLSKTASLLAGACYMFSPYLVSLVAPGHDAKTYVTALFPLVILFLERGFEKKPFMNFTFMGLVIGVIILSPHPQLAYFTLIGMSLYAAFKLIVIVKEKKSVGPAVKPALLVTYAVVIGLLLSAIQFYPGYLYTTEFSPRADAKSGWNWATSWSMHEEDAFSLLIPEFAGVNAEGTNTYYWGKNAFKDNSEVVGSVVFFLALMGFLFARRKEGYFFGALAVFALLYSLGATTPMFKLFYWIIPKVKSMRAPAMMMLLFSFSAALLAGMGIQFVRDRFGPGAKDEGRLKKFSYFYLGFPAFMLVLAFLFAANGKGMLNLWASLFYSDASTTVVQQGFNKLDVAYLNLPAIQSGAWFAFLATALASLCIWLYRTGKTGVGILLAVAFIPVYEGVRFDSRFVRTFDHTRQWATNPMTDFFTSKPDKFRVLNFGNPNSSILPYHKIEVVVGYHGNQLRWYDDLIGGMSLDYISRRPNPGVLNLVGTKYILLQTGQMFPEGYFGDKPVAVAATFGQTQIVQNNNAFPRVFLVDKYQVFEDRQDIYPEIAKRNAELRDVVYLEKEPDITIEDVDSDPQDSVWIKSHEPETVLVGMNTTSNKLLVLTDNYYDAWHVTIDGQPAELLRSYGAFRAVAVPAGSSEVAFNYESQRYSTGKTVTLITTLYFLGVIGFFFVGTVRRKKQVENK